MDCADLFDGVGAKPDCLSCKQSAFAFANSPPGRTAGQYTLVIEIEAGDYGRGPTRKSGIAQGYRVVSHPIFPFSPRVDDPVFRRKGIDRRPSRRKTCPSVSRFSPRLSSHQGAAIRPPSNIIQAPACSISRQGKLTTCRSRREAGSHLPTRAKGSSEASVRLPPCGANILGSYSSPAMNLRANGYSLARQIPRSCLRRSKPPLRASI